MGSPVFDPSILDRLSAQASKHGDTELVRDLVSEALTSISHCAAELEVALVASDLPALRSHAHRIKSVLRQVGALSMADAAARCEALAARGDVGAIEAARDVLARRDASLAALRARLDASR
ncbi:MAG: Hpt domain-containing protein [Deltaproteobacteria bacterium]|nr:Hpt domain-containing protein [Deltaproteobacteria bacterium]